MTHTVGIAGSNGNVGTAAVKALLKHAQAGAIKLVVYHREGAAPKGVAAGDNVELRVLDFDGPADKAEAAVKGVNVFISAVGGAAKPGEIKVVEALGQSPDIVTFIPARYTTTWDDEDGKAIPGLGKLLDFFDASINVAKQHGVAVTLVNTGGFDVTTFTDDSFGWPVSKNAVRANAAQLKNQFPITTMQHLGSELARIASLDPHTIKNKEFSVVSLAPTGQELLDAYTAVNGSPAKAIDYTAADRDQFLSSSGSGPIIVGYFDRWAKWSTLDQWGYTAGSRIAGEPYAGPGLKELVAQWK